jgi:hypothetical protein
MSAEHFPGQPETHSTHYEHLSGKEQQAARQELMAAHTEKTQTERLQEARETINEQAEQSEHVLKPTNEAAPVARPHYVSRELRSLTAARSLTSIRHSLNLPERALSRAIHAPVMRNVSQVGAKTVARPSGLLYGGLLAFLGTTAYVVIAKHIGWEYNYGVWATLFVGGFLLGLILEALSVLLRRVFRKS